MKIGVLGRQELHPAELSCRIKIDVSERIR